MLTEQDMVSSRIVKADYVYMRVAEMHLLAAEYAAIFWN